MIETLTQRALADLDAGDAFFEHLADGVVVEFPYGPSLGLPARVEGIDGVRAVLGEAQASGLTTSEPTVSAIGGGRVLAAYTGTYHGPGGARADVPLIALIEHEGDAITLIREYWDTLAIARLNQS